MAGVKTTVPEMYLKQLQGRLTLTAQHLENSKQAMEASDRFLKDFQRGVQRLAND